MLKTLEGPRPEPPPLPPSTSRAIKSYYEKWWENPEDLRQEVFERLNEKVADVLAKLSGRRALDLGSGRGRIVAQLETRGFRVSAVEFNPSFVADLRASFPRAEVIEADLRSWTPEGEYEVATCIEVTQVLSHPDLTRLLVRLRPHVGRLVVNISNSRSLHGIWVRVRRFQAPFIVPYTPSDLYRILQETGYRVLSATGVGLVSPLSLMRDFRGTLVSPRTSRRLSGLDSSFPDWCHLVLVEAVPTGGDGGWEV